jgi:hypothetical protein
MPFSLNYLTKLPPAKRNAYVLDHLDEVEKLTVRQQYRIGTLLCHASSPEVRDEYKIIGDLRTDSAQEVFEIHVTTKGPAVAQEIALGKPNGK